MVYGLAGLLNSHGDIVGLLVGPLSALVELLAVEGTADVVKAIILGLHIQPTASKTAVVPVLHLAVDGAIIQDDFKGIV